MDTDSDLMPDIGKSSIWKPRAARQRDHDEDGVSNITKYRTGTNPAQPNATIHQPARNWTNIRNQSQRL